MKINVFWFRRDLRLDDNNALNFAFLGDTPVMPLFIFDTDITGELPVDDSRINFIYNRLHELNRNLSEYNSSILILKGHPEEVWKKLIASYDINGVFFNKDYEPYAISRDQKIAKILTSKGIPIFTYKDQVIFDEKEILTSGLNPYTIFTPYKNKWIQRLKDTVHFNLLYNKPVTPLYFRFNFHFPSLEELGFRKNSIKVKPINPEIIGNYGRNRDNPFADLTSHAGPHLRFGTVSIRRLVEKALAEDMTYLSELAWREFFMQILFNFPHVVTENFRKKYDNIDWRNNEEEFERWCKGTTGFPIVDAGMRELNETGYMHNRVRMITAGFLCKNLLIDWRWGESYFALKLLDYELSSNNGNWQWAAGTGCDAAPYFRVFNPYTQQKRFDPAMEYIKKWIPEFGSKDYPEPVTDYEFSRKRAIETYRSGLR